MREREHLAMASVPSQSWGELYDPKQALKTGTIFKDLNLPFFAAEDLAIPVVPAGEAGKDPKQREREELLGKIQEVSFYLDDLRLYLDTHPEDPEGLSELKKALKQRKQLLKEFAVSFYPLTFDCLAGIYEEEPERQCFCWEKGPAPWEGACV